jgi:hypothetical protein
MSEDTQRFCFVVCPIGAPGSDIRERSDAVLDEIIKPALEPKPRNFRVERANDDPTPGSIPQSIIGKIFEADLVVADLTGSNANVMYELAVRHATGKPFVHIIADDEGLPFDISAMNTIFFAAKLAGRSKVVKQLQEATDKAMEKAELDNPIRDYQHLLQLRGSATPDDYAVADALSEMRSLAAEVRSELRRAREPLGTISNLRATVPYDVPLSAAVSPPLAGKIVYAESGSLRSGRVPVDGVVNDSGSISF